MSRQAVPLEGLEHAGEPESRRGPAGIKRSGWAVRIKPYVTPSWQRRVVGGRSSSRARQESAATRAAVAGSAALPPPPAQELGGATRKVRVLAQRQQQRLRLRPGRRHRRRQQGEQEQGALQDEAHQLQPPRAVGLAAKGLQRDRQGAGLRSTAGGVAPTAATEAGLLCKQ